MDKDYLDVDVEDSAWVQVKISMHEGGKYCTYMDKSWLKLLRARMCHRTLVIIAMIQIDSIIKIVYSM